MIPGEILDLIAVGPSVLVGTRDGRLLPESMRGMGVVVDASRDALTVFLPKATAGRTIANLADNGCIAVTCSHVVTHRTFQLKGRVAEVREASEDERGVVERYRGAFFGMLATVGMSPDVTCRAAGWPVHAVEVKVEEVYDQTPGPGAGARLSERGARP